MKHKITIYSVAPCGPRSPRLWYANCSCGWEFETRHNYGAFTRWGRPSWDAAFALGVAHQKQQKEVCTCDVV